MHRSPLISYALISIKQNLLFLSFSYLEIPPLNPLAILWQKNFAFGSVFGKISYVLKLFSECLLQLLHLEKTGFPSPPIGLYFPSSLPKWRSFHFPMGLVPLSWQLEVVAFFSSSPFPDDSYITLFQWYAGAGLNLHVTADCAHLFPARVW